MSRSRNLLCFLITVVISLAALVFNPTKSLAVVFSHSVYNEYTMAWQCSSRSNAGLVKNLRAANLIATDAVERVMMQTDRKFYVAMGGSKSSLPERMAAVAYEDSPVGIGFGATISAPHMHAMVLELLAPVLDKAPKPVSVLDVGAGSGYLCSCFQRLVGKNGSVFGVDYIPQLVKQGRENIIGDDPSLLASDGENPSAPGFIRLKTGDGWEGWKEHAPFDAIHVGAAAATLPDALVEQLKPGGRMIVPVGRQSDTQVLLQVDKELNGKTSEKEITWVKYVPLVKQSASGSP